MFIDRDDSGNVKGLYACAQYEGQEEIADDSPEVAEFHTRAAPREIELTPAQKLERAGLTVDDLRQLLDDLSK